MTPRTITIPPNTKLYPLTDDSGGWVHWDRHMIDVDGSTNIPVIDRAVAFLKGAYLVVKFDDGEQYAVVERDLPNGVNGVGDDRYPCELTDGELEAGVYDFTQDQEEQR